MTTGIYLYVEDCDATYRRALEAGATSIMEPTNQFYGDRSASIKDQCGNHWYIATHIEDLSKEDLNKRMNEYVKKRLKKNVVTLSFIPLPLLLLLQ
jgi:PhnB protein